MASGARPIPFESRPEKLSQADELGEPFQAALDRVLPKKGKVRKAAYTSGANRRINARHASNTSVASSTVYFCIGCMVVFRQTSLT